MEKTSKISPGIVQPTRFLLPGSQNFGDFIDYMDADASTYNKHVLNHSAFADYMDNDAKSYGLFDQNGFLGEDGKKIRKQQFSEAEACGSPLWQQLFSFNMDWLAEYGIYDKDSGIIHEDLLRTYTASAINKMLEKEEFSSAVWTASIHHNTEHLHVHIAIVDSHVTWVEGHGRCRRNKEGKLYQRGKFKPGSLTAAKRDLANNIMQTSDMTREINDIMRRRIVAKVRDDRLMRQDIGIHEDFKTLLYNLPDDLRLWKYGMNAMESYRPQIDALSNKIIHTYFSDDYTELTELLQKADKGFQYAYGQTGKSYESGKIEELYEKLGNAILKEGRTIIAESRKGYYKNNMSKRYGNKNAFIDQFLRKDNAGGLQRVDRAIGLINRAFYRNINSIKNQAIYQRLQSEKEL